MRTGRFPVLALGLALSACAAFFGCGGGTDASSSSSSSSSGSGGSTGVTVTSTTTSAGGSSTTGSGAGAGGSGGAAMYGYCSKPCAAPADCCPPGDPSCPGDKYPNNYTCKGGACLNPACASTSDCTAQNPKLDCFTVGGVRDCAYACAVDGDCNPPQTCVGEDDDGKKFCLAQGSGCTDEMCATLGIGKCIGGVCSCATDGDCTKAGFTKCAK